MKALVISEDESLVSSLSAFLKSNNFEIIVYKWLLKALDNIEEISPDLIILNSAEYPRHWKTLVQFVKSGIGAEKVCVFLYEPVPLSDDDFAKAEALGVNGCFNNFETKTLDQMKKEVESFFKGDSGSFIITDPETKAFIFGTGTLVQNSMYECVLSDGSEFKAGNYLEYVTYTDKNSSITFSADIESFEDNKLYFNVREIYE